MTLTTRRTFLNGLLGAACMTFAPQGFAQTQGKYNVLFIAVDSLRPQLGCYGFPQMKTPNLDRLAANGIRFERAYCQLADCNPSRSSALTGLRPDTVKIYDPQTHFRLTVPDAVTLPQYFKKNGYYTQALSSVFHSGLNDPDSWSAPPWTPDSLQYASQEIIIALETERQEKIEQNGGPATEILQRDARTGQPLKLSQPKYSIRGPSWESADIADNQLPDGETTDRAIELLRVLTNQRFFIAVGFSKPHLPFVAPKTYFDLYPLESIPLPENPFPPKNAPEIAMHNYDEIRSYNDIPQEGSLTDHKAKELIRAYSASISYLDAQIGRIIAEVERLNFLQNTVIVLWSDHGWQMGEHALWCAQTNFEMATRIPLIVSAPGILSKGIKTSQLVESVDLYPSLCELCGLPIPDGLEGVSLLPLFSNPDRPWKRAVFSQFPRGGNVMGYTMRTDRYRYTEWIRSGESNPVAVEFYDHISDPGENDNAVGRPENKERIVELKQMLQEGWQASRPLGITSKTN